MKLNRAQLFLAFALFWVGLGWLGLLLALLGSFYANILWIYIACGVAAFLLLFFYNWDEAKKINRQFLCALAFIILAVAIFSIFTSPTIFSGRDQGSLSEAAIRLSQNHQLKFSFQAEKEFFQIYGPGKALNFPGFNYTADGQLITQFPLGYISWLAVFYSIFGLSGLVIANGILYFLFAVSFYLLLRLYLQPASSFTGLLLALTAFPVFWFFKFTLSENIALALVWLGILSFVLFWREEKRFYLLAAFLTFGLLAFARIEALAFLLMIFLILLVKARRQQRKLRYLIGRKILWTLAGMAALYAIYAAVDSQFFITLAKTVLKPFSDYQNAMAQAGIAASLYYVVKVLFAYYLLNFLLFGFIGLVWVLEKKREAVIPFLVILPSFIYLAYPDISPDHPWMLRRFLFSIIPAGVFYTILLFGLALHPRTKDYDNDNELHRNIYFFGAGVKKRALFYVFSGLFLALNLVMCVRYFAVIPHQKLLPGIEAVSQNFSDSDLILVDQKATGDGWSMMTGPMNFLYGKQAVYFFNPADLNHLQIHNYTEVYFIIPDSQLGLYANSGILEKSVPVKSYSVENNFLQSNDIDKNTAYHSSVILPREQTMVVSGKLYLLNK